MPYHLIVSHDANAFKGNRFEMPSERCLENAYTDTPLRDYFAPFPDSRNEELLNMPALIAYERETSKDNIRLVKLLEIKRRGNRVRGIFEPFGPEITLGQIDELAFDLDIDGFEFHRTHWALKNVDIQTVLARAGIETASFAITQRPCVDVESHIFRVALSFPGEARHLAQEIAHHLEGILGHNSVFYDFFYQESLARPSLDLLLHKIYFKAKLNVVFLSKDYQTKPWCSGVEFRVIRDLIADRQHNRVMYIRTDDGDVEGVFKTDGYIDARVHSPKAIAAFIERRLRLVD